jgi:hypothetical protein
MDPRGENTETVNCNAQTENIASEQQKKGWRCKRFSEVWFQEYISSVAKPKPQKTTYILIFEFCMSQRSENGAASFLHSQSRILMRSPNY